MAEEKPPEFQVTDRRRLTPEGNLREDAEDAPRAQSSPPPPAPAPPRPAQQTATDAQTKAEQTTRKYADAGKRIGPSFDKIIIFFTQTAMLQLGLLTTDPAQPLEPDLFGARETIDMLALLQEKTRGNLTSGEQRLLENSLYELRMAWLELNRKYAKAP